MDKKSLETTKNDILSNLDKSDINIVDKVELMMNLDKFLDSDNYEDNIKKLNKK